MTVLILPMRNGNIEALGNAVRRYSWFLSYLWGMETQVFVKYDIHWTWFLSYLWGMETVYLVFFSYFFQFVLILPMRNGNKFDIANDDWVISCSYPTYEEWKLASFKRLYMDTWIVLILPMRNGNLIILANMVIWYHMFLSYLWGMETLHFSKRLLLHRWVLILPMRNGNV